MLGWLNTLSEKAQRGNVNRTIQTLVQAANTASDWKSTYGSIASVDAKRIVSLQHTLAKDLIGPVPLDNLRSEFLAPVLFSGEASDLAKRAVRSVFDAARDDIPENAARLTFPPDPVELDVKAFRERAHRLVERCEQQFDSNGIVEPPVGASWDECRAALVLAALDHAVKDTYEPPVFIRYLRKAEALYNLLPEADPGSTPRKDRGFRHYFDFHALRMHADDILFIERMLNDAAVRAGGEAYVSKAELLKYVVDYDRAHLKEQVGRRMEKEEAERTLKLLNARYRRMKSRWQQLKAAFEPKE